MNPYSLARRARMRLPGAAPAIAPAVPAVPAPVLPPGPLPPVNPMAQQLAASQLAAAGAAPFAPLVLPPAPIPATDPVMRQMAGDQLSAALANRPGNPLMRGLGAAGRGAAVNPTSPYTIAGGALGGIMGEFLRRPRVAPAATYRAEGGPVCHCQEEHKAPPRRMAAGGAAKERKDYPYTRKPAGKNSLAYPLATVHGPVGGSKSLARGMGKATRGNKFKI